MILSNRHAQAPCPTTLICIWLPVTNRVCCENWSTVNILYNCLMWIKRIVCIGCSFLRVRVRVKVQTRGVTHVSLSWGMLSQSVSTRAQLVLEKVQGGWINHHSRLLHAMYDHMTRTTIERSKRSWPPIPTQLNDQVSRLEALKVRVKSWWFIKQP